MANNSIYDRHITLTETGATIPNASVSVIKKGGGQAALFYDRAGANPAPNPFTADAAGRVQFYLQPALYDMQASHLGGVIDYPDVLISSDEREIAEGFSVLPTVIDLIGSPDYIDSPVDDVVEVIGYSSKGDGGAGQWRKTGVTGLTASQTPAQLVDAKLTDANGHEWEIVLENGDLYVPKLGAKYDDATDDSAVHNAALSYLNSNGGGNLLLGVGKTRANIVHTFDSVGIIGRGRGSVVAPTSGTGLAVSGITGGMGGLLHNFVIDGVNGAATGLSVSGFSRGKIGDLWLTDLDIAYDINGDASTEFTNENVYITNPATRGLRYLRTDGVDTGGIYFDTLHITGGVTSSVGIECTSTHTSRTRAFMFINKGVIDNRSQECLLLQNVESFFISQLWATGTAAGRGMVTLSDVKDCFIDQAWLQNSDAGGYNLLVSGGGSSLETSDLSIDQLRTSGPGTSVQFNGSPTLTRCNIGEWNDTASTKTNDDFRLSQMRGKVIEGDFTVEGVLNVSGDVSTLTVASGIVTASSSFHRIAPETGTTDTLSQINSGVQGDKLTIMVNSSANTITVAHGTGNIFLDGSANKVLDNSRDKLELVYFNGEWQQTSFSSNG